MRTPYPVAFDVERPPAFQRAHVFLRVALLVVIGWIAHPIGLLWLTPCTCARPHRRIVTATSPLGLPPGELLELSVVACSGLTVPV